MGLFVCECSKHSEMTSVAGKAETQALEMECLVFSKKLCFFFFLIQKRNTVHMLGMVNLYSMCRLH